MEFYFGGFLRSSNLKKPCSNCEQQTLDAIWDLHGHWKSNHHQNQGTNYRLRRFSIESFEVMYFKNHALFEHWWLEEYNSQSKISESSVLQSRQQQTFLSRSV